MKKQPAPEPAKTKNVIITGIAILMGLFLLSAMFALMIGVALLIGTEETVSGNVAVIEVKGAITGDQQSSFTKDASSSSITRLIRRAGDDPKIEAVVIEINSPGGSPVASAEIARAIKDLNKPSVAWIREVGASGGYWVASAADHVVAHELSVTGSIGVIASYLELSGLLARYNISYQRLVAGEYKDTGTPLRPLRSDEESLLQGKLDAIKDVFVRAVAENRNLTAEQVESVADGMFLLGSEAYDAGLVDAIGGREAVDEYLESLGITPEYGYLRTHRTFMDALAGIVGHHGFSVGEGVATSMRRGELVVVT